MSKPEVAFCKSGIIQINGLESHPALFKKISKKYTLTWSNRKKNYIMSYHKKTLKEIKKKYEKKIKFDPNLALFLIVDELEKYGYSPSTIKSYLNYLNQLIHFTSKKPKQINEEDTNQFIKYIKNKGASPQTINVIVNAVRFTYTKVWKKNFTENIKTPQREKNDYLILNQQKLTTFLSQITDLKHRILMSCIYYFAFSIQQAASLEKDQISLVGKEIRFGDKNFIMNNELYQDMKEYIENGPDHLWLFPGRYEKPISRRRIETLFKEIFSEYEELENKGAYILRQSRIFHLIAMNYSNSEIIEMTAYDHAGIIRKYRSYYKNQQNI